MPRQQLTGGAYQARSVIASAQRCMNLFPEAVPTANQYTGSGGAGEAASHVLYPTPGLRLVGQLPKGPVRAIKQVTTGGIYAVGGDTVYRLDPTTWAATALGTITPRITTPVSMQDNGLDLVIVDGSSGAAGGWKVTLATDAFALLYNPTDDPDGMFAGADKVDFVDTYLVFNKPSTPQFYWSGSLATTFDSLDFADKETFSDMLVTLAVARGEIWLLGDRTTEIWQDTGYTFDTSLSSAQTNIQSTFQKVQSTFVDHGCVAKYSAAVYDNSVFWLSRDRQGQGVVLQGSGYKYARISTFAIEDAIARYPTISDAVGFCFLMAGHAFYALTFPTADHTWVYDITAQFWHEWVSLDAFGAEHRHRANCAYPVNDDVIVGDWQNGNLYALDRNVYDELGIPIKRQRAYPHILNEGDRVYYRQFIADIETGTAGPPTQVRDLTRWTFGAANGTRLQDYLNPMDSGLTAVPTYGNRELVCWDLSADCCDVCEGGANGQLVGYDGLGLYQPTITLPNADYSIAFRVTPPVYDHVVTRGDLWIVGRAAADLSAGYRVRFFAEGDQYVARLAVLNTGTYRQVALGTIPRGNYFLTLSMFGAAISLTVQRSWDGLFLGPDGTWARDGKAVALTDTTYTAPGIVLVGGDWSGGEQMVIGLEDGSGVWGMENGLTAGWEQSSGGSTWGPTKVGLEDDVFEWRTEDGTGAWKWFDTPKPELLGMDDVFVSTIANPNQLYLDWSDDRGHTFGNPVGNSFGGKGEYLTNIQFQRLGYARDRVFRVSWTSPTPTALQGAWIEFDASAKT